jgi:hypothetical protein
MKEDTTPIDPTWMSKTGGFAKDMTMRDHYAGLAMQILKEDIWNFALLSTNAYELADAMLAARKMK